MLWRDLRSDVHSGANGNRGIAMIAPPTSASRKTPTISRESSGGNNKSDMPQGPILEAEISLAGQTRGHLGNRTESRLLLAGIPRREAEIPAGIILQRSRRQRVEFRPAAIVAHEQETSEEVIACVTGLVKELQRIAAASLSIIPSRNEKSMRGKNAVNGGPAQ